LSAKFHRQGDLDFEEPDMKRVFWSMVILAASGPAMAGDDEEPQLCYETVGCVSNRKISEADAEKLGCEQLWTVRNGIYAVRGYCFKTDRGKAEFGTEGCQFDDEAAVPLNDYERANVAIIKSIEKRRGC
jgi:hypothetical protein